MSFESIDNKLDTLIRGTVGNIPESVLAGALWYQMQEIDKSSTFNIGDAEGIIDSTNFNLVVVSTDGDIKDITYKKTFRDGTQEPNAIQARIDNRIVGEVTQIDIGNSTAQSGFKIYVEKYLLPPNLIAGVVSNLYAAIFSEVPDNGLSLENVGLQTLSLEMISNGSTMDIKHGNELIEPLESAARTETTASADLINYNARGVMVLLRISAVPGTDTVQLRIQGKLQGEYFDMAADSATSATGLRTTQLYPGAADTDGQLVNISALGLCRDWRILVKHVGNGSFTYSVTASYIN